MINIRPSVHIWYSYSFDQMLSDEISVAHLLILTMWPGGDMLFTNTSFLRNWDAYVCNQSCKRAEHISYLYDVKYRVTWWLYQNLLASLFSRKKNAEMLCLSCWLCNCIHIPESITDNCCTFALWLFKKMAKTF